MWLRQDIRQALRLLRRTPGITVVALVSIAITIGATAVVFAAIRAVLLDPLPYANARELVQFRAESSRYGGGQADWVSWTDMQDVIHRNRTLESIGIYRYALFNLFGDGNASPEALYGLFVSASMFPTLGVKPMLGRNILPDETQLNRDREMVLSHGLWVRRFNSDPKVIGRTVEINGHDCTIIGVMPPGFDFPMRMATTVRTPSQHMDFWAPLAVDPEKVDRNGPGFGAVGRVRPGVSQSHAEQDVLSISAALAREFPRTNQDRSLRLVSLRDRTFGFARTGLLLLLAAAVMFLLIGCANVANLVLTRTIARHREIAVRLALGAGRSRIVRQLVIESCVLGIAGGLAGVALAMLAWRLLPSVAPMTIPRLASAHVDWMVFAFTLTVSLLSAVAFGILPALAVARHDPAVALRESATRGAVGGARNRLRSALVIGEVAVAVTLVVIGGLLTGSFVELLRTDPGFEAGHVLASIIIPSGDQYKNREKQGLLFRRILDSVRTLPDVTSAGTVDALPFSGENHGGFVARDESGAEQIAEVGRVSSGYLQTMGVRLLDGRFFRDDDMLGPRDTAIVNDVAARSLWPGQSAIGKRICIHCPNDQLRQWKRIVGVVTSLHHASLEEPAGLNVYYAAGALQSAQFLVVRTSHPSSALAKSIQRAVAAVDPKQPVFLSAPMSTFVGDSIADRRFILSLLAITGCLALLLAAAGVYGVVSYLASARTQEIGVRMALGAAPRHVHRLIFGQGMLLAAAGVCIGLAASLALTRLLRNVLTGLVSFDPVLIATAVLLVIVTAAIACTIPARRATHVDPMVALRQE